MMEEGDFALPPFPSLSLTHTLCLVSREFPIIRGPELLRGEGGYRRTFESLVIGRELEQRESESRETGGRQRETERLIKRKQIHRR